MDQLSPARDQPGRAAYPMGELQSIHDPGIQHVIEIQTKEQAQRDVAGDPPA